MGSIAVFGKGDHIVGGAVQNPAQLFSVFMVMLLFRLRLVMVYALNPIL